MLKFVRTKNYQMPGSRQMLNMFVKRDEKGRLVQEEYWQENVVLPKSDSKTPINFKRTYCVEEKPRGFLVEEEVISEYFPSCSGDGKAFASRIDVPEPPSKILEKVPIPVCNSGAGAKGTVFDTLCGMTPVQKQFAKYQRTEVARKPTLRKVPFDTYIEKKNILDQLRDLYTGAFESEVVEESPMSSGQSVRDIAKSFEKMNTCVPNSKSGKAFVHRIAQQKNIKFTAR